MAKVTDEFVGVSNGAKEIIEAGIPYVATVVVKGVAPLLFHAWNTEEVEAKGAAAKGSAAKKTDDLESYVYRCDDKTIGVPGSYLMGAICGKNGAAKYRQDPRSPRKSALDLYKGGVVVLTPIASLGAKKWDFVDARRAVIQQAGITRRRPGFNPGWQCTFEILVNLPEYISQADLLDVLTNAGKLVGFADMRPTYGRFQIVRFTVSKP